LKRINEVNTREAWLKKDTKVGFCLTLADPASSPTGAEARAADSSKEHAKEKMEDTQDKANILHFNLIRDKEDETAAIICRDSVLPQPVALAPPRYMWWMLMICKCKHATLIHCDVNG